MNREFEEMDALMKADLDSMTSELSGEMLEDMFEQLSAVTVDRESGLRDRLRELSTPRRVFVGILGVILVSGLSLAVQGPRGDLATLSGPALGSLALKFGVMLMCAGGVIGLAFRGIFARPLGRAVQIVAAIGLLAPAMSSLVPGLWEGLTMQGLADGRVLFIHLYCGAVGLVVALFMAAVLLVLERGDVVARWRLVMVATGGGLAGFVAQTAHCPYIDPVHLILSHGSYGVWLSLILLLTLGRRSQLSVF